MQLQPFSTPFPALTQLIAQGTADDRRFEDIYETLAAFTGRATHPHTISCRTSPTVSAQAHPLRLANYTVLFSSRSQRYSVHIPTHYPQAGAFSALPMPTLAWSAGAVSALPSCTHSPAKHPQAAVGAEVVDSFDLRSTAESRVI